MARDRTDCWIVLPNRSRRCDVRLAGLQMAEPLGGCGPAHLYESLVGVVFRRHDRDRRLVPVRPLDSDDAVRYLYHSVSDTIKSGNCGLSRLINSYETKSPV